MTDTISNNLNQAENGAHKKKLMSTNHLDDSKTWYLVHCKPNAEQMALRNLENQGFSVFLPLQKMTNRQNLTFRTKTRPLFPGYIFVAQNHLSSQLHKVNNTRGVARIVRLSNEPTSVPTSIMRQLFACCDETSVFQQSALLNVGEDVKIIQGSLTGSIAKIIKIEPSQRVHLLFHFMGQESTLEIDVAGVVPVS